ncbi:DUF6265 family protein [uncultured Parasphingopyxis sp.]|uniref:DUF6265 family protein n=1 Tax=uncultured Parasphingopyxis sp. TaxID=1547918 RepID=UPI002625C6E7|nr:DUF6265 family protein [uncultured Parasphingopyxis sp.]
MKRFWLGVALSGMLATQAVAQDVRSLGDATSPLANVAQLDWLVGQWEGEGFGARSQEAWLPPTGDMMTGIFVQSGDDGMQFSELIYIVPRDGTLVIRLKHFNADLSGWEDNSAESPIEFPLVAIEDDAAYFSGLTYELVAPDRLEIHLRLSQGGETRIETFRFTRAE